MKNVKSLVVFLAILSGFSAKAALPGYECEVIKSGYGRPAGAQLVFKKLIPYTTEDFSFEVLAEEESKNIVEIRAVSRLNVLQISSAEPKTKIMQAFAEVDLRTRQITVFDPLNNQRISCKKVLY